MGARKTAWKSTSGEDRANLHAIEGRSTGTTASMATETPKFDCTQGRTAWGRSRVYIRHRGHADHVRRVAQLPLFHDGRVVGGRRGDLPALWHVLQAALGLTTRRGVARRGALRRCACVAARGVCGYADVCVQPVAVAAGALSRQEIETCLVKRARRSIHASFWLFHQPARIYDGFWTRRRAAAWTAWTRLQRCSLLWLSL